MIVCWETLQSSAASPVVKICFVSVVRMAYASRGDIGGASARLHQCARLTSLHFPHQTVQTVQTEQGRFQPFWWRLKSVTASGSRGYEWRKPHGVVGVARGMTNGSQLKTGSWGEVGIDDRKSRITSGVPQSIRTIFIGEQGIGPGQSPHRRLQIDQRTRAGPVPSSVRVKPVSHSVSPLHASRHQRCPPVLDEAAATMADGFHTAVRPTPCRVHGLSPP